MCHRYKFILPGISWLLVFTTSISLMRWDLSDFGVTLLNPRRANAQAASPTTFYWKNDGTTANSYWGVAGPTAKFSSDTDADGTKPTGKATAYAMHPIAGPLVIATTFDSTVAAMTTQLIWFRTFIMPLASGMTFYQSGGSAATFTIGDAAQESSASANSYQRAFIYVYDSGNNNKAATLAGPTQCGTEIGNNGTSALGQVWTITNTMSGNYTTDSNDFLAVEIWITQGSSTSYNNTLYWGGNTVVANNGANTTPASYVQIGGSTVDTFDPLYFLPTSVPPQPSSDDPGQSGDSFAGGTFDIRRMSTVPGAGAETNTEAVTGTTNPLYWKQNIFMSPPLAAQTIPAGNWVIHLHGYESNANANAQIRGMIYTWNANDTMGDTIISVYNGGTEWTTDTTNNQFELIWAGSAATISAGERLVAEWYTTTLGVTGGPYNVSDYFGSAIAPSTSTYDSCILPPMLYSSNPAALSWQATSYDQVHFRFDQDNDNGQTHATWTDRDGTNTAEDTASAVAYNANTAKFRLRIKAENKGGTTDTLTPQLQYRVHDPPGSWTALAVGSGIIQIIASDQANFVDGTATTEQLTADTGYTFVAGTDEEDATSGNATMNIWNSTEYEWCLQGTITGTFDLRMTDAGVAFDTYADTKTPLLRLYGYNPQINNWRWYGDEVNTAVETPYAAENTAPAQIENGKSIPYKLRANLTELDGIAENNSTKSLQYATNVLGPWTILGQTSDTGRQWRYYNGGGTTGDKIPSKVLSDSNATDLGTVNENSTGGQANSDHPASETVEWEFCIQNYSATANTTYYFSVYDETLAALIPLGSGKSYPSLKTAATYDLSITAPSSVGLGDFTFGSAAYHSYTFSDAEKITIRENSGANALGWTCTASISTELNYREPGTLGTISFTGSGLNDMSHNSTYTGTSNQSYSVKVIVPGPTDIMQWSRGGLPLGTFSASTDWTILELGVGVKFGAITGHTLNDHWDFDATAGTLHTIADDSMYWIANNITGLYAADTTGISTQSGSYMGSAVTSATITSPTGIQSLGGFTQIPTIRVYNIEHIGNYRGALTITLIANSPPP